MKTMDQKYAYITAQIDCGTLTWKYQVEGMKHSSMRHDEDVSEWSDSDIKDVTMSMLGVDEDQRSLIEIQYM